jgi:hypothetical protein
MLAKKRLEKSLEGVDLSVIAALAWAVNIENCRVV